MAIINTKKWASRPHFCILEFRFYNIQDYWYSVFIVISNDSLVSIRSIRNNNSIPFACKFGRLISLLEYLLLFHLYLCLCSNCLGKHAWLNSSHGVSSNPSWEIAIISWRLIALHWIVVLIYLRSDLRSTSHWIKLRSLIRFSKGVVEIPCFHSFPAYFC